MGLLKAKKAGVQKILFSDAVPKELFQTAEPKLLDPVKRTVYLPKDSVKAEWLESGYLALAEYSMLNTPKISCYATNKAVPNALLTSRLTGFAVAGGRGAVGDMIREDCPVERRWMSFRWPWRCGMTRMSESKKRWEEMLDCLWRKIDGKRN